MKDVTEIVSIIEKALIASGAEVKKYSESKNYFTTADECLMVKTADNQYFSISIDKEKAYTNPNTLKRVLPCETFNNFKRKEM